LEDLAGGAVRFDLYASVVWQWLFSEQCLEYSQPRVYLLLCTIALCLVEIGPTLTAQPSAVGLTQGMKRKVQQDMFPQWRGKIYRSSVQDRKHRALILSQPLGIVGELIGQVDSERTGDGSQAASALDLHLCGDLALGEEPIVRAQEFDLSL